MWQIANFFASSVIRYSTYSGYYVLPVELARKSSKYVRNFSGQTTNPSTFSVVRSIFSEIVKPITVKRIFPDFPKSITAWTTLLGGHGSFNVSTLQEWTSRLNGGPMFIYAQSLRSEYQSINYCGQFSEIYAIVILRASKVANRSVVIYTLLFGQVRKMHLV